MDSSKLIERGGLVYHLKPNSLFHGKGVKISDTPFNGKAVTHYSSGEVQIKATYKDGISIQFSYLGIDGTVLESSEIILAEIILALHGGGSGFRVRILMPRAARQHSATTKSKGLFYTLSASNSTPESEVRLLGCTRRSF